MSRSKVILIFLAAIIAVSCSSSTKEGEVGVQRRQLLIVPSSQIESAAAEGYEQVKNDAKSKGTLDKNPAQTERLRKIAQKIIPQTPIFREEAAKWQWEVHSIASDELNAYCMPGGKIVFYSGIIDKLKLTDGEIAAIMGHEMAHALREHGRERMSEELIKQIGIEALLATGKLDQKYAQAAMIASTVALTLPHSRGQETEADTIGVELMARAGFNPQEAVTLWQKMNAAGGGGQPEFMSTHPSSGKRIESIQALLPKVMPLYQRAKQ